MDPFMIGLNIVCGIILVVYIVLSIIKKNKTKHKAAEHQSESD